MSRTREPKTEEQEAPALIRTEEGLALVSGDLRVIADFTKMKPRIRQGNLSSELLVRAAKLKHADGQTPVVLDATAGLGEDSFLLAAAGFQVILYEYNETVFRLLSDAVLRAKADPELAPIAARMTCVHGDSTEALQKMVPGPDVVYLDPMFPERTKSALIKKKFQLMHGLEKPCGDEEKLLLAAMAAKPRKIVIKRPLKGECLAGRKPDYSLLGKAIRYDCFTFARDAGKTEETA